MQAWENEHYDKARMMMIQRLILLDVFADENQLYLGIRVQGTTFVSTASCCSMPFLAIMDTSDSSIVTNILEFMPKNAAFLPFPYTRAYYVGLSHFLL